MTVTLEVLQLPRGPTPVQWRHSARARRVSLRIDPRSSSVVVTLPDQTGRAAGMAMLTDHAGWIASHLAALPAALTFADGTMVPVAGEPHRIRHISEGEGSAWLEAGEIHVPGDPAFLAGRVTDLLWAEARRRLGAIVAAKCAIAGLSARRVTVKDTRTRWGSCTPDGTLMFCWRLVMAPMLVQDYAVAHEVAHLRHMNHGPRFWALVRELTLHEEEAVGWLRLDGATLLRAG
jgi:predicted metal-dependent hydrolase